MKHLYTDTTTHLSQIPSLINLHHSPKLLMKNQSHSAQVRTNHLLSNVRNTQQRHHGFYVIAMAFILMLCAFQSADAQIPVTVTGNTNTTPNLAATYTSLALALTDLNLVTAMTGPVTLTLADGSSETAPVKGFAVGSATLDPVLSATNTITIIKASGTVTINAGVGTSAGPSASPDGMLYLNGADYVTIDGLTFTDGNSASSTVAMEFGIALFKRTAGDGCNNNTIQNCTFNMQRINNASGTTPMLDGANAIEVLNSTVTAATTSLTPTNGGTLATNGTNSANKFYTNAINGGNIGIGFGGYAATTGVGPTPTATTFLGDLGNDVGGTVMGTGNTILNFGGGAVSNPAAGIRANNEWSMNIQWNIINNNDGGGVNHATTLRGIYGQAGLSGNVTISNNTITVKSVGTTTASTGIENVIGSTALSNTVTITNNIIQNCTYSTATTATFTGILAAASATNQNVNNNQVINNTIGLVATASSCTFQGIYASASSTNFTANSNTVAGNIAANSFATMYCIRASTSTLNYDGNTISNNTIPNNAGATSSSLYGFYNGSSPVIENYTNNNINNLSITGSNTATSNIIYGIYILTASGAKTISGNNINNLTFTSSGAGYAAVVGIRDQYASTANIFKNVVHTLSSTGTTPTVIGIMFGVTTFTTANVYNNIVGNLTAPASTGLNLFGIWCGSVGTTYNVSYNTVYLNATSSASGSASAALYMLSTTPTTVLIDNILVNLSTGTTTWTTAALRRISTVLTSYGSASNNNFFYAGTPSATNLIYYDGTNSIQTMSAFKTLVAPRESASVTETVSSTPGVFFQSFTGPASGTSTTFLHMVAGLATQVESGGITVAGILDDYDGNTRNVSTPDMGADEFTGIAIDLAGPNISFTPLSNGCSPSTNQILTTTITDATGVPTSGIGLPMLYYKVNAGAYVGLQAVFVSGSTYTFTFGAAATNIGDVVSYYIVAQDIVGTPNLNANPSAGASGYTANPPAVSTPPTTPMTFTVTGILSGNFSVGVGGSYTTLTAAVADYNAKCLSGAVVFNLVDATYPSETLPITINANAQASAVNTLTIKPKFAGTTFSGSLASGALIKLNGADYVIIDGSTSGGTDRSLTITNSATTAPTVISLVSLGVGVGATNNTIKNCNLSTGIATTIGYGISVGGSTPGTSGADNDNTTLQNNNITVAPIGIYANGTASVAAGGDDNLAVTGNTIDYNGALATLGIQAGNALNSSISQNTVSEETTTSQAPTCISLETGFVSSTVTRNRITKALTSNTGGYGGRGITVGTGTATSSLTIANNVIYGVNGSNWSGFSNSSSMGIAIGMIGNSSTISTTAGGINLYFNSVNMTGSMGSGSTSAITAALYIGTGGSALNIRDNVFVNSQVATATTQKNYAIYSAGANTAFTTINNNDYFASNSFNAASAIPGFIVSDRLDLAAIQAGFGSNANSLTSDPQFNGPTNLVLNLGSPALAAGENPNTTGITTDFLGTARATPPSMGAYEAGADAAPPSIVYTPLLGTCSTSDRMFTATLADGSGIATAGFSPRVYYKKGLGGTWYSSAGSLTTGTVFNGTWTFTIVSADMGGIASGDAIYYYVIAQDAASPNFNIGSNPSAGLVATNVNIVITPPTTPNTYNIQSTLASGIYSVGAGSIGGEVGHYATLTAAATAYNNSCMAGAIVFGLTDAAYSGSETFPIIINANGDASATNTLTIRPVSAVNATITGNSTVALLKLNGADYVTIDGLNTGGSSLTITNTNNTAAGTTIWIASASATNGATNNFIKNCSINGGGGTTHIGDIIAGDGTTLGNAAAAANSNNTIMGCTLTTAQNGIYISGLTTTLDQNWVISGNSFGSVVAANKMGYRGLSVQGVNNFTISNNTIAGVLASTSSSGTSSGISVFGISTNGNIFNNKISDIKQPNTTGWGSNGIDLASSNTASNINVYNNFIWDVASYGYAGVSSSDNGYGIMIDAGGGYNIYYNSVSMTTNQTLTTGLPATVNINSAVSTAGSLNIRNNIFSNTQTVGTNRYSIYCGAAATVFADINYNDYYFATNPNLGYLGSDKLNLAAWQAATGKDANSLSIDPVFTSTTDLHLQNTSLLDGLATPIAGITTDIDGNTRDVTTPDIGADEFLSPACSLATGGTAAITGSSSFCGSGTPVITASGYSTGTGSAYQWQSSTDGFATPVNIMGQTNPGSLTTGVVTTTTSFRLKVRCNTAPDSMYSNILTVTIIPLPTATLSPFGTINLCPPTASQLLTSGTNASSPSYVWKKDGVVLGGEVNPTYSAVATGSYVVVVTDGSTMCSNTSIPASVIFNVQPASPIVTPSSVTMCSSDPAVLLTASGSTGTGTTTANSGAISIAIPDVSSTGISSPLSVTGIPGGATIDSVITTFSITHGFDEDIIVDLEAPNGQIINLVKGTIITTGTNFTNTNVSSDPAKPAFPTSGAPFTSTYKADAGISGFQLAPTPLPTTSSYSSLYSTPNGTWKIRVYDDESIGVGTLTNWAIKISYSSSASYAWTPNGGGSGLFTDAGATMVYSGAPSATVYAKPGSTATYTVTATGNGGCTNSSNVTVTVNPSVIAGTVSGTSPVCVGDTPTYTSNGTPGGTWSSTVPSVATVVPGTGVVTALSAGMTDITYTLSTGCGSPVSSFKTLMVNPIVNAGTVTGTTPICIGVSTMYTSSGTAGGTWTSTDPGVATVDASTGVVTAVSSGMTDITYSFNSGCGSPVSSFQTLNVTPAVVMNDNDGGAGSLRDILSCIGDAGGTITFDPSIWNTTIVLINGTITINKNITIEGPTGADVINISANGTPPAFNVVAGNFQFVGNVSIKQ